MKDYAWQIFTANADCHNKRTIAIAPENACDYCTHCVSMQDGQGENSR